MDKMELIKRNLVAAFIILLPSMIKAQINLKAPVKTADSVVINAPIERVWDALTQINQWNRRYDFIINAEVQEPLKAGDTFKWQTTKLKIKSKLTVVNTQKQLCWKGGKYGVLVYHNWAFRVIEPNKTLLVSEESQQGLPVRLFQKSFSKSLKEGSVKWLNQIKNYCEK